MREWYSANYIAWIGAGIFAAFIGTAGTLGSLFANVATGAWSDGTNAFLLISLIGFCIAAIGTHSYKLHLKTDYLYEWQNIDDR